MAGSFSPAPQVQSPAAFWNRITRDNVGKKIWHLSDAEDDAGISVNDIDRSYPWGSLLRHGALIDDAADDSAAWVQALSVCDAHPILPWFGISRLDATEELDLPAGGVVFGAGPRLSQIRRASGTADIFELSANDVFLGHFGMLGPNNTSCDGIIVGDGVSRVRLENLYGTLLSSTVTAGLDATCNDVECLGVYSDTNTQQGINFNFVNRGLIQGCTSVTIGSTNLHHGFYIDRCLAVRSIGNFARGCFGAGFHVFVQETSGEVAFAARRVVLIGCQAQANGAAASGVRGGFVIARADDGSSLKSCQLIGCQAFNNTPYQIYAENVDELDIFDCDIDGNSKTVSGCFVGTTHSGLTSRVRFRGNRCRANIAGLRISVGADTTLEMKIGGNEFEENTDGIYKDGSGTAQLELEPGQERGFRSNSTADVTGAFVTQTLAANISTMAGGENFRYRDGTFFHKDPGGANRLFNPSPGTVFPAGHEVTVVNAADAAENITFDSGGLAQVIAQGERGIFRYTGSAWVKVFTG